MCSDAIILPDFDILPGYNFFIILVSNIIHQSVNERPSRLGATATNLFNKASKIYLFDS
jgi:hypothetical protein